MAAGQFAVEKPAYQNQKAGGACSRLIVEMSTAQPLASSRWSEPRREQPIPVGMMCGRRRDDAQAEFLVGVVFA
jgi:hypothetical protein